jgi:hypothetical protein
MASFNKTTKHTTSAATNVPAAVRHIVTAQPDTTNLAGGKAFKQSAQYQLAFLMLTSFVENQFYRTAGDTLLQLRNLISQVDPKFAAKAAIYARTQAGMRSISHASAAEIVKIVKGEKWTKHFLDKVIYRVDDAAEILAAYIHLHKKPIPNSLKKGLALGLGKFDRYQLAKYKGETDAVKLVDLFNLVHPKPSAQNAEAYKDLMEGKLASTDTWESELSAAGQTGKNKGEVWAELVTNKKLGYFALLRNMRNILQNCSPEILEIACAQLVDEKSIKRSLVLPFRYMVAIKEMSSLQESGVRKVIAALDKAAEIALCNVPKFEGNTLVALDCSGSMGSLSWAVARGKGKDGRSPAEIGALFGAVLTKTNDADFLLFDDRASYHNINLGDTLSTITKTIAAGCRGGGTDFNCIFKPLTKKYDRIIILSDMQAWIGHNTPQAAFGEYCKTYKASPKVYCFDLAGYGSMQFPAEGIYQLAGFSDKTMDLMQALEKDPSAILTAINAVELPE